MFADKATTWWSGISNLQSCLTSVVPEYFSEIKKMYGKVQKSLYKVQKSLDRWKFSF